MNSDEFATNWEDLWKLFTALLEIVRRMEFSCNSRPRPCVLETRFRGRIFLRKPLPRRSRSLFYISCWRSFLVDRKWDLILTRYSSLFPSTPPEKVIFPIDHRATTIRGLEESSIWRGNDARNATDVTSNRVIPFHLWYKPLVRVHTYTFLYLPQFLSLITH